MQHSQASSTCPSHSRMVKAVVTHTCPEGEVTVRSRSSMSALPVLPLTAGGSYHAIVTLLGIGDKDRLAIL